MRRRLGRHFETRRVRVVLHVLRRRRRRALLVGALPSLQLADKVRRHVGQRLRVARRPRHSRRDRRPGRRGRGAHDRRDGVGQTLFVGLQRAVAARLGPEGGRAPRPTKAQTDRAPGVLRDGRAAPRALVRRPAHVRRRRARHALRVGGELRGPDRPRHPTSPRRPRRGLGDRGRRGRDRRVRAVLDPRRDRRGRRLLLGLALGLGGAGLPGRRRRQRRPARRQGRRAAERRPRRSARVRSAVGRGAHARGRAEAARRVQRRRRQGRRGARRPAPLGERSCWLGLQRVRPGPRRRRLEDGRHRRAAPRAARRGPLRPRDAVGPLHRRRRRHHDAPSFAPICRCVDVVICGVRDGSEPRGESRLNAGAVSRGRSPMTCPLEAAVVVVVPRTSSEESSAVSTSSVPVSSS
mmetsp:Transcript_18655/g.74502  ORF Transcript_18655/g.74502 Transcript_18655/m.74502 type:complete len:408 (+) Transcript_18655:157-1380(+)